MAITFDYKLGLANFLVCWKVGIAFYNSLEEVGDEIDQIQGRKSDFDELSSFLGAFVGAPMHVGMKTIDDLASSPSSTLI